MKFEREYVDGNGRRFRAVISIGEGAGGRALLEKAFQLLANRARDNMRKQTNVLGGAIHCIVHPIKEGVAGLVQNEITNGAAPALATNTTIRELVEAEKCSENPSGGPHSFTADVEYDSTGQTINCEFCGEAQS